jgi:hypothetical protein
MLWSHATLAAASAQLLHHSRLKTSPTATAAAAAAVIMMAYQHMHLATAGQTGYLIREQGLYRASRKPDIDLPNRLFMRLPRRRRVPQDDCVSHGHRICYLYAKIQRLMRVVSIGLTLYM